MISILPQECLLSKLSNNTRHAAVVNRLKGLETRAQTRGHSIVVRFRWGPVVVQKILCIQLCRDDTKLQWQLIEVEAVGQIVGACVRESERWQTEIFFDEPEDAAEIMGDVRHIAGLGIGRDNEK